MKMIDLETAKKLTQAELLSAYLGFKLDEDARQWALEEKNIHQVANSHSIAMFGG